MKAVIAMDSYKGSLTSIEAGEAAARGIKRVYEDAEIIVSPVADGGEGSAQVITKALGGEMRHVWVKGPLGQLVDAAYGWISDTKTAVIEMALAAGLTLISAEKRDPMVTTTYGVGELIKDAIARGARHFVVCIGGSATNDGGVGMLSALGFSFLDQHGRPVEDGAAGLAEIREIQVEGAMPELSDCTFSIACDVQNPLCGELGCSAVYGPQKGADAQTVKKMDAAMLHFEQITRTVYPHANGGIPGSGAAGGLGFAFMTYLGGVLLSGIELITAQIGLEEKIRQADVVITGEGRMDGQSQMGKAPIGVAKIAKKYSKPVLAFAGCVTEDARICNALDIDAFFPILRSPCTVEEAMDKEHAENNLSDTVEQVFRVIRYVN